MVNAGVGLFIWLFHGVIVTVVNSQVDKLCVRACRLRSTAANNRLPRPILQQQTPRRHFILRLNFEVHKCICNHIKLRVLTWPDQDVRLFLAADDSAQRVLHSLIVLVHFLNDVRAIDFVVLPEGL
jgi:hypothetical protein